MKCIICEKNLNEAAAMSKHDVFFCGEECLTQYEKKLEDVSKIADWDKCC